MLDPSFPEMQHRLQHRYKTQPSYSGQGADGHRPKYSRAYNVFEVKVEVTSICTEDVTLNATNCSMQFSEFLLVL